MEAGGWIRAVRRPWRGLQELCAACWEEVCPGQGDAWGTTRGERLPWTGLDVREEEEVVWMRQGVLIAWLQERGWPCYGVVLEKKEKEIMRLGLGLGKD